MRIKEVTQQTGLTDKAIRLYIENGLVSPKIEEAYNGRKKIDFSDENVARLKNIALLRKAGLSINDIKQIICGGEAAKETVESFIEKSKQQIEQQSDTVAILENADFDSGITIESLCDVLSASNTKEPVPKEDMEAPLGERILRQAFSILGIVGAVVSLIPIGWFLWAVLSYKHLRPDASTVFIGLLTNVWFIILFFLWINVYRTNTENRFFRKKRRAKLLSSAVLTAVYTAVLPGALIWFFLFGWAYGGNIYCETDDPEHYLDFYDENKGLYSDVIDIFPSEIPEYAENIKYYYRLDGDYHDIFAEWRIPEYTVSNDEMKEAMEALRGQEYGDALLAEIEENNWYEVKSIEYEKAKASVIENTLSLRAFTDYDIDYDNQTFIGSELKYEVNKIHPVNKGDWVCYYFRGNSMVTDWSENESVIYNYLIFAYNDKTQTVRYISSKNTNPYLAEIEW